MDELKIKSLWAKGLVSDAIRKTLKKKLEFDMDIQVNDIEVSIDSEAHVHLDLDATIEKGEVLKLIKQIGF